MRMKTHGKKSAKVPASGTGAGDLLTSDAVRGGSLVGRPITPMGCEPAVVSGRPATHPVELRARIDRGEGHSTQGCLLLGFERRVGSAILPVAPFSQGCYRWRTRIIHPASNRRRNRV